MPEPQPQPQADEELPELHFGRADAPPLDWRKYKDDSLDDDEPLAQTPASTVAILGFDPLDLDSDE
jgi:hypothetical protein